MSIQRFFFFLGNTPMHLIQIKFSVIEHCGGDTNLTNKT